MEQPLLSDLCVWVERRTRALEYRRIYQRSNGHNNVRLSWKKYVTWLWQSQGVNWLAYDVDIYRLAYDVFIIYIYSENMVPGNTLDFYRVDISRACNNTTTLVSFRGGTNSRVATADARPRFWWKLSIGMKMFYSRESTKIPRLGTAAPLSMYVRCIVVCVRTGLGQRDQ